MESAYFSHFPHCWDFGRKIYGILQNKHWRGGTMWKCEWQVEFCRNLEIFLQPSVGVDSVQALLIGHYYKNSGKIIWYFHLISFFFFFTDSVVLGFTIWLRCCRWRFPTLATMSWSVLMSRDFRDCTVMCQWLWRVTHLKPTGQCWLPAAPTFEICSTLEVRALSWSYHQQSSLRASSRSFPFVTPADLAWTWVISFY